MNVARRSTFAARAYDFYTNLEAPRVPRGIRVMNPYTHARTCEVVRGFLDRFYADRNERVLVFGINPGRFGAGITGVTFTDPIALADFCGIPNDLPRKRELSSVFVYEFIERFGGVDRFFSRFFLTAASPLGFTRRGVNYNYYDDRALLRAVTPFIVATLRRQIALGASVRRALVFGAGENFKVLRALNEEHGFFADLRALDHPRFILQYRRKRMAEYLARYAEAFAWAQATG